VDKSFRRNSSPSPEKSKNVFPKYTIIRGKKKRGEKRNGHKASPIKIVQKASRGKKNPNKLTVLKHLAEPQTHQTLPLRLKKKKKKTQLKSPLMVGKRRK